MLKPIGAKEGKIMTIAELFYHLTDDDLIALAEEDQLEVICRSLTLELMTPSSIKNEA
jgi:hypothetical protein